MKPRLKMVEPIRPGGGKATHVISDAADFAGPTLLDRPGAFGARG